MQRPRLRFSILVIMVALLTGACNSFNIFHSSNDKSITNAIQAKLFGDPVLKTRDLHVDSQNGIVTLTGTVDSDDEKASVERLARREDGVRNVMDLVAVSSRESPLPAPTRVQQAENAAPARPDVPAPPNRTVDAESRPTHRAPSPSDRNKSLATTRDQSPAPQPVTSPNQTSQPPSPPDSSAALRAYTNSIAPDSTASNGPSAAPTPSVPQTPAPTQVAAPPAAQPAAPLAPPVARPAPRPQEHVTVQAGTVVTIRMIDNIDSSRNQPGEEFAATLDSPITVDGRLIASRGVDARVRLVEAKSAGQIEGRSELQLELINVTMNGVPCATHSGYYEQHGGSKGTRSAETIGGGAVLGAVLGGILGRGKGAAIGSIAGAGAGTAVAVSTKGQQVKVPSETKLDFTLKDPVDVPMRAGQRTSSDPTD